MGCNVPLKNSNKGRKLLLNLCSSVKGRTCITNRSTEGYVAIPECYDFLLSALFRAKKPPVLLSGAVPLFSIVRTSLDKQEGKNVPL
jgi:hypothetical protein